MDQDLNEAKLAQTAANEAPESEMDQRLLALAKRRVLFRKHFVFYALLLILVWVLWIFNLRCVDETIAWPILPTVLGGAWIVILYYRAFVWGDKDVLIRKEIEKLKQHKS